MANMSQVMSEIERDRLLKSLGQSSGTNASSSQGNDNVAGGRSVRFSSAISRGPSGKQQATRDTGLSAAAVAGVSRLSVNSTAETLIGSQKAEHNEEEDDEDLYLMQVIEPPAQQQKRRTAAASAPSEPSEFPKRPLLAASLSPPNGTISAQMQQPKQKAAMKQTVSDPRLKQVLTTSSPDPHQAQQQPVIRPPLNSGKFIQQAIARLAAEPFDQTALHNRMPATMTKLRRQAAAEVCIAL
jgi:hypothetical protein